MKDLVIIGAGPAGVCAAIYAKRSNLDFLIFEKNCIGGNVVNAFEIENYPGVGKIVGSDLAINFMNELDALNIEMNYEEIVDIEKKDDYFVLTNADGVHFESKKVLLALGTKSRRLGLANEESLIGRGVSFCATCDGAFYKDKIAMVVGGGNSALTEAQYLAKIAKKVYIITRHELKGAKKEIEALNNYPNIEVIEFKQIKTLVTENNKLNGVVLFDTNTKEETSINLDGVFVYIGQDTMSGLVKDLSVTDERGFIKVKSNFETDVDGLYAVGDCIVKEVRQVASAVGDAATAMHFIEKSL